MSSPLIMLEFNELSPTLMDKFIGEGRLPAFASLKRQSIVYTTDAELSPPYLEPWIQWVTVHTGVPYEAHGIFDLSDGHLCSHPRLWDRLAEAGRSSWVCGSMNTGPAPDASELLLLPDPWATGVKPHPPGVFDAYYHLVSRFVQEHASKESPVSAGDTLAFARFMVANGLSAATVTKTLRQLLSERGGDTHWRRAVILDRLQWDVFRSFYRRRRPDFSTFFLNSTAHFQHYHWRDMEPERFTIAPDPDAPASLMDAIRYGYECMDRLVGECLQMAPDATIVLATALSQQALTSYDEVGGKQVFKARSVEALMAAAGVARGWTYAPVMAEEFKLRFSSVAEAETAERRLDGLRMDDGQSVLRWRRSAETIFLACALHQLPAPGARVVAAGGAGVLFNDLFMPLEGLKSGAHHPDGILWWRLPQSAPAQVDRKVSLETIAPTVLDLLGVPAAGLREPLPEVLAASKVSAASSLAA